MIVVIKEGEGKKRRAEPIAVTVVIAVVVVIAGSAMTMFAETLAPFPSAMPAMHLGYETFIHEGDGSITKV